MASNGPEPLPAALLAALAFVSGCVDVLSYLAFGRVFTANMTGNTVLLGIALITGPWAAVARSGCALAGFCAGVAIAAAPLQRRVRGRVWPRMVTAVLAGEALLLVALTLATSLAGARKDYAYWTIALAGLAMGFQSAAVRSVAISGVYTTYVTGMLTKLMTDVTGALMGRGQQSSLPTDPQKEPSNLPTDPQKDPSSPPPDPREEASGLRLPAIVWATYLAAAVTSAAATDAWGISAAWIPVGVLSAIVAVAALARQRLA